MRSLRHHFLPHRWLAAWLTGLALLARIVVPAGYMPVTSGHMATIQLCSGFGTVMVGAAGGQTRASAGMTDHMPPKDAHGGRAVACGFGGLASSVLAADDMIVIVPALAFVGVRLLIRPARVAVQDRAYVRPPLRGPPARA